MIFIAMHQDVLKIVEKLSNDRCMQVSIVILISWNMTFGN